MVRMEVSEQHVVHVGGRETHSLQARDQLPADEITFVLPARQLGDVDRVRTEAQVDEGIRFAVLDQK